MRRITRLVLTAALAATVVLAPAAANADQRSQAPQRPQLYGTTYHLQNYFAFGDTLTPFFDAYEGRVGPGAEIADGYIYAVDIQRRAITLTWNTDPAFDAYEPYVGKIGGLTQEQAAGAPMADEYWITFGTSIRGLSFRADPCSTLKPKVRVIDDNTIAISIPGGTTIGDGYDARIQVMQLRGRR